MNNFTSATDVVHWFKIVVYDSKRNIIERLFWSNLSWKIRIKYDWYFKYRAALFQVKYPRNTVEVTWGNVQAEGKSLNTIIKNKIKSKRAKITEYKNKLQKVKNEWVSIFPIEEDISYKKAIEKINRLDNELQELLNYQSKQSE